MDSNVYVIDSDYIISRYILGPNKEFIEQIVIEDDNGNEDVEVKTDNRSNLDTVSEHDINTTPPRNTVFMPCYGNEKTLIKVMRTKSNAITNVNSEHSNICDSVVEILYDNNKNEEQKRIRSCVSKKKHKSYIDNINNTERENQLKVNVSPKSAPLTNFINDCYMLYPDTHGDSGTNYANERYMLYSGAKTKLRNRVTTDSVKMITNKQFKRQLIDTSDILSPLTLLPHTRKLMKISSWKFSKSLTMPQTKHSVSTKKLFERNCISNPEPDEIDTNELGLMPIGYTPQIDRSKIKRITRRRKNMCLQMYPNGENLKENEATVCNSSQTTNDNGRVEVMDNELQVLNNSCYLYNGRERGDEQIIVVHDGQETAESTAYTQQNIEVLLAAAAEEESSPPLVICQSPSDIVSVDGDHESLLANGQQIIFIQNGINTVLPVYSKT